MSASEPNCQISAGNVAGLIESTSFGLMAPLPVDGNRSALWTGIFFVSRGHFKTGARLPWEWCLSSSATIELPLALPIDDLLPLPVEPEPALPLSVVFPGCVNVP